MTASPRRPPRRVRLLAVAGAVLLLTGACTYRSRAVLPVVPTAVESSTVYAADGTLLHTFHAEENRKVVPLDEIPLHVRDAVIAIEDERYYRHSGVDVRAVLRAMRANAQAGTIAEGGSTITQQYVKKVLLQDSSKTFGRKIEEASMALQLERNYSKDRILELYLNAIYFGNGAYGIEAAARQYFGKPVQELTLAEGALIAGLIQRPGATDPYHVPDVALTRRNLVLERMRSNRFATDAEVDAALAEPLTLGSATTPAAERYPAAYFVEEVKQWVLDDPRFGATAQERRDLLFGGGLRIQTTLDLGTQAEAEAAVAAVLPDPAGPAASMVAIEPATGYVRAMVGGRDFFGESTIAKLNLATQGPRQAGSSFKPLVLAAALEQGIDPETVLPAPACISIDLGNGQTWRPCNYGGGGGGSVSIIEGTVRSYNTLYAQLMMRVGPKYAMEAAARYGIRSPLEPVPSAVLGSNVVTALDMASAYSTFANRGIKVPPILVTRITRADGTILFQHQHTQTKVMETPVADTLTSILRQVIERGTGTKAQIGRPAAGKTGTADDWKDAWFAGYTPELATAVWVGFPEVGPDGKLIRMQPPHTAIKVTGGSYPAQIWQRFMAAALADVPPSEFAPPPTTTTTSAPGQVPVTTTSSPAPQVTVPAVVGQKVEDATQALQAAGFVVERIAAADGPGPPGRVVAQSPPGGTSAEQGSTVRIEVSGDPSG
ncbi:MAG TPA: PBP1A family penicillin-binding protein [Acidimicrobiales bacterium]|nr:PBP1A family penicillin-binding protein [Acidimicrobiales bacterium]